MKLSPAILGLVVLLSCGKKENAETSAVDSTAVTETTSTDTSSVETTPAEVTSEATEEEEHFDGPPPGSFAEDHYDDDEPAPVDSIDVFNLKVTSAVYSDSEEERAVVEATIALLQEYNKMQLEPVKRTFTRRNSEDLEDEGGGKYTSVTGERSKETWWYDGDGKLRAYSSVYKRNDDMDGFDYLTTVYLFRNDSIVAGYEDANEASQIATNSTTRFVMARCPACGTAVGNDTGSSNYNFSTFQKDGVDYMLGRYAENVVKVTRELKEGFPTAKLSANGTKYKYTVTEKDKYPPVPYKVTLEIGKSLYEKLFP